MCIFPKGLTHDFPQKFEISSDLDMMMNNVLNRKNGFLDYKNVILKECEIVHFSKAVKP